MAARKSLSLMWSTAQNREWTNSTDLGHQRPLVHHSSPPPPHPGPACSSRRWPPPARLHYTAIAHGHANEHVPRPPARNTGLPATDWAKACGANRLRQEGPRPEANTAWPGRGAATVVTVVRGGGAWLSGGMGLGGAGRAALPGFAALARAAAPGDAAALRARAGGVLAPAAGGLDAAAVLGSARPSPRGVAGAERGAAAGGRAAGRRSAGCSVGRRGRAARPGVGAAGALAGRSGEGAGLVSAGDGEAQAGGGRCRFMCRHTALQRWCSKNLAMPASPMSPWHTGGGEGVEGAVGSRGPGKGGVGNPPPPPAPCPSNGK